MAEMDGRLDSSTPGENTLGDGSSDGHPGYGGVAVREQADRVKQQARAKGSEIKESAQRKVEELKEQADRRTGEAATRAGGRVSVLARALRRAGEELRTEGEGRFADLTDDAAAQVDRIGSYLEGKKPNQMLGDLEREAKGHPAFFVGGTFALGLLVGRFLRSSEPAPVVEFEPEGDWGTEGGSGDTGSFGGSFGGAFGEGLTGRDPESEAIDRARAMTPGIENISAEHPSQPNPGAARVRTADGTPVRTPIAGHETMGPGVRTGSSGAAALDAGSGGPAGGYDPRANRAEPKGEGER